VLTRLQALKEKKRYLIILVLMVLILGGISRLTTHKPQPISLSNSIPVQVQAAANMQWESVLTCKADLQPGQEGILGTRIAGQVVRISFKDGDMVSRGQALVALDDQVLRNQLQAAQVNLRKLEASLVSAQRNYDRIKALYDSGASSKSVLEDSSTNLEIAKATVEAEQVNIQNLDISLNDSVICAPINGEISEKGVSVGQYVTPGIVLARIKDSSSVNAVIQVKADDLGRVRVGQKVTLKLSRDDKKSFPGTVTSIDKSAVTAARIFNCQVLIANRAGLLHSGLSGYIDIADGQTRTVVAIPLAALTGNEGDYSVFTVQDGVARKCSVNIGEIANDMVEIQDGVKAGEKVIITNLNSLQDGDKVELTKQGA